MGVNRVTLTLTLQGNPTYKKLKEIADAIDDSELIALIQYKGEFYKVGTIEELEKIVAKIKEK